MTSILDLSRPRPWNRELRRLGFEPIRDDRARAASVADGYRTVSTWRMTGRPDITCEIREREGYGVFAMFRTPWGRVDARSVDRLHVAATVRVDGTRNELETPKPNVIDLRPVVDSPVCARLRALGFHTRIAGRLFWRLDDEHGRVDVDLDPKRHVAVIVDRETEAMTKLTFDQLTKLDRITHGWNDDASQDETGTSR